MRKRSMTALVASLLLLTACTAPAEKAEGQVPAADAEATDFQERADPAPESPNLLPDLDVSGLEETMPETDFAAFRAYLPVLTGEESFRWVAGPYDGYPDGDWEPFDADMAAVHDRYWSDSEAENPPETLTLDRLAVADIVGGEEPELPASLNVLHHERIGRVHTYIVRGNQNDILAQVSALQPILLEAIPLTLEEIFIYEMGGADYAVHDIVL